ncbi:MAG: ABC transporter ATP-binding protein [Lachnospiraceae bacterium]|nr:ABC transporter ATP-binding protein [Lachnospiraceae bacterium]
MELLKVEQLKKIYTTRFGGNNVQALREITFSVEPGEYVAIMGESGSGKTTLLNILATLDKPTEGNLLLDGKDLGKISEKNAAKFRREQLGFVFQEFNLLDTLSVKDNILLPLVLSGCPQSQMMARLKPIANRLHITELLEKYPYEVSGGQKQRTAIARALIMDPKLILADEPTGALDSHAAMQLLEVFGEINRDGQTVLMVTHSTEAASHAKRVLFIKDGIVYHQLYRGEHSREEMYQMITNVLTAIATGGERKYERTI